MLGICRFKKVLFVFASLMLGGLSLTASAGDINVNLSSPATSTTGNYTVTWTGGTYYSLMEKKDSGNWSYVYNGTASSKAFSGKSVGTYSYKIQQEFCFFMYGYQCFYLYSDPVNTVVNVPVPSKPGNISGPSTASYTTTSGASYTLSWGASSGTVTKYELQEKVNSGNWSTIHSSTSRSKGRSGKTAASYYYRVRACNGGSCSAYTSTKTVTVSASYILSTSTASTSSGNFTLSWTVPSAFTTYQVEQQLNGGSWGIVGVTSSASYSFTGKADGNYNYRVNYCFILPIQPYYTVCSATSTTVAVLVAKPPGVPASISGVPATDNDGAFTVSWGSASGTVASYKLEQQKNSGNWTQIYSATGTSKAVSALGDGTYKYRVRACNGVGCSGYRTSGSVVVTNLPGVPGAITGVSSASYIAPGGASYTLNWGTATGAIGSYELQEKINAGSWGTIQNTTSKTKAISGNNAATYYYRVRACNAGGCSGYSAQKAVTVTANYSLSSSTSNSTNGSFSLSWTNPSSHPIFQVEEQFNAGSWTLISQKSTASHSLSNKPNGTYNYRIQYCITLPMSPYNTVCSATSNTKQVVVAVPAPSQPSTITGPGSLSYSVPGGVDYSIDWANSTGTVTAYDLERKVNSGSWTDVLPANTTSARSFNDELEGTYQYRVRACNGLSCSGYSPTKTVTVAANYTLTATPAASPDGNISLSWTNPGSFTTFQIEEQVGSGGWNFIGTTGSAGFSPPNRADGTYNYRIQYCITLPISPFNTICTETSNTDQVVVTRPPGMPISISNPGGDDNGAFSVSWSTASGVSPTYTLERENNGSGSWTSIYTGTSLSTNVVTGLADGSYKFRVKACNVGGCSLPKVSTATLVANKPGVPGTITGNSGTVNQSVALSWPAATGNVDKYTLQQRFNGGTWTTIQDSNARSKAMAGIADGTYDFQVRACNNYSS